MGGSAVKSNVIEVTSSDGLKLYGMYWAPDQKAEKATVYLVHGLGEHVGRYVHVARALTDQGASLIGVDLRGHGLSGGPRGHTPSIDQLVDDLRRLMATQPGGGARFIYGHSNGGALALYHAMQSPEGLSGVIATGAWLGLRFKPPASRLMMARAFNALYPRLTLSSGLEVAALSRDPAVVAAYQADPLVHDRISARWGAGFLELGPKLISEAPSFTLPLLMMHGSDDRLTDPEAAREFFSRVSSQDKTLHIWPGLYHEIHNEPEQQAVIAEMVDWIVQRRGGRRAD
jgi:alpha-beta hydrolase superfamily lysophospholipase